MKKGFSLLELLVVVAIMSILSAIVLGTFNKAKGEAALVTSADAVFSLVNRARTQTISSKDEIVYGVHFEESKAVLFAGAVYDPDSLSNVTAKMHSSVQISDIELEGGGSEVVFDRLSGATGEYGTTTISLINDPDRKRYLRIYQSGITELVAP